MAQFVFIPPPLTRDFSWGFGVQAVFPTSTPDNRGGDKYLLAPLVGTRLFLPEISKGSFFLVAVRHFLDMGKIGDASDTNELDVQPVLNIVFPEQWFVTFWADKGIKYNFESAGSKGPGWFIPFDMMIGKVFGPTLFGKGTVASVSFSTPIYEDEDRFPQFDARVEARIGFFF